VIVATGCPLCGDCARDVATSGVARLFGAAALRHCFLYEDDDLFLIPGPGNFAVGYLILAPHEHYLSFAVMRREVLERAQDLLETLVGGLTRRLRTPVVVFEHGAADSMRRGAACVDHAHVHVAPAPRPHELRDFMRGRFEEAAPIDGLGDLARSPPCGPYVLFGDGDGWSIYSTPAIQRQLLRRLLTAQHGRPSEWNWRLHPNSANFWRTALTVRELKLCPVRC
jgi:diadenosine tetraphosphate (Ap4A) HIT family hydrolase